MNFEPLEKIANAVLYEGFLLYPYRKSSIKNQQRWHFGTLGPRGGTDPTEMQTECLVESSCDAVIDLKIRFLQDEARTGADPFEPSACERRDGETVLVPADRRLCRNRIRLRWPNGSFVLPFAS